MHTIHCEFSTIHLTRDINTTDKTHEHTSEMMMHEQVSSFSAISDDAAANTKRCSGSYPCSSACCETVSTLAQSCAQQQRLDAFRRRRYRHVRLTLVAPFEHRAKSKAAPEVARRMSVLYSYPKGQRQHLSARQGELLTLLERSDKHCGWALMCAANGAKGFFPLNNVVNKVDEPESHAAFMQVDRREAERLLLYPGGALGSFLMRSHKDPLTWTLSVLQRREKESARPRTKLHCGKHYIAVYWCTTLANASTLSLTTHVRAFKFATIFR